MTFSSTMTRRAALAAVLLGGVLVAMPALALDSLKLIAPANPGGGWDQTARSLQGVLTQSGAVKAATVENIGGAGGTVGLAKFITQEKGKDALLVNGLVMVGAILTNKSPVDLSMTTPIARLTGEYEVIVVPAASELRSMADLVAKFKASPGSVSWGGGSAGGTDHILAGLIANSVGMSGAQVNYVPFSGGGEALAAVLGGHVTAGISGLGEWIGQIKAGQLRALAVSSPEPIAGVDIKTLGQQGIAVELSNWRAVVAPPGVSAAQRTAITEAVTKAAKSPQWAKVLDERGWMDLFMSGDAFKSFLEGENVRVTKILKEIGLVQ